ncbi:MAG: hypothetical protein J1E98_11430 [Lachnospiraceae bacterium]|nr:hypothetical protein [Lachnospiraceae bacterium]
MFRKIIDLISQSLFTLLALYLTYLLLRYPSQALEYASTGLTLWFQKMIPTLLPFMILSGIMVRMNMTERFARCFHPLFHKLWGTSMNGSYAILMGMLCGFPMGARVIGELCKAGKLSEDEGAYLLAFCNNIGPIYFLSFVMSTLSISGNYIPFAIMYGVPLCYGYVLRFIVYITQRIRKLPSSPDFLSGTSGVSASLRAASIHLNSTPIAKSQTPSLLMAIDDSVISGLIGIGKLGGYMVFFNLLNILFIPFSALPENFLSLCNCILEITSGISRTGGTGFYMILILLPFGGLSCIAQTYSMIKDTNLSINNYFIHKCIQTAITALIYLIVFASSSSSVFL